MKPDGSSREHNGMQRWARAVPLFRNLILVLLLEPVHEDIGDTPCHERDVSQGLELDEQGCDLKEFTSDQLRLDKHKVG
jgi:hypothetical protein